MSKQANSGTRNLKLAFYEKIDRIIL